ncbi:MAG: DNA-protecting protein DprA [Actinobacteria bacterium]|nr:DNA-protecting protein DprA [Actinomycetota bacterium]
MSRVAEPGHWALWRFVEQYGPIDAVRAIVAGTVPDDVAAVTAARRDRTDPDADLDVAARHGIRLLVPESARWPTTAFAALQRAATAAGAARRVELMAMATPPLALWVKGSLDEALPVRSVAIVGSRSSTAYGDAVAAELAFGLARRGVVVISGGAFGIDAAAHRAALAAEGATVIVSAGGLDRPYPAAHANLFERVAHAGALISESPPGTAPQRHRFLSRNRLIAALAGGTVVVEAALRSGALNTAAHCVNQGRPLMVVPGPVTSGRSAGCHALLRREGYSALLVESVDDVIGVVGRISEVAVRTAVNTNTGSDMSRRGRLDSVDALARRVFDGLPARGSISVERLASRCGFDIREVIRALPVLEMAGLVERDESGVRIAVELG